MTPHHRSILGMRVDATSYEDASARIAAWAAAGESRAVFVANVNNVMESYDDPLYRNLVNGGDLVTPDGMPLVWGLRRLGEAGQTRVYGPDLTRVVCRRAEQEGIPVGLLGGTEDVLALLQKRLAADYPRLAVPYAFSPPFRPLTDEEDCLVADGINASGARILLVGLGAPKQERWIAEHRGRVSAVMLGVGAAFDFIAGTKRQAPRAVQQAGLEWLFRLATEPRRLARRYLRHNPRFVVLFGAQLVRERSRTKERM